MSPASALLCPGSTRPPFDNLHSHTTSWPAGRRSCVWSRSFARSRGQVTTSLKYCLGSIESLGHLEALAEAAVPAEAEATNVKVGGSDFSETMLSFGTSTRLSRSLTHRCSVDVRPVVAAQQKRNPGRRQGWARSHKRQQVSLPAHTLWPPCRKLPGTQTSFVFVSRHIWDRCAQKQLPHSTRFRGSPNGHALL